jgi:DinB superfamily
MTTSTIRPAFSMWPQYNRRLREVVGGLTDEQLAIRPAPDLLPIWATIGHSAAMRVYWLCAIAGEPGADTTPFWVGSEAIDWADDLDHPRGANELAQALDSTFAIVERCLDRWTTDMLDDEIQRHYAGTVQVHTRSSILQRLLTHEAWHAGELSQTLGIHGLPQPDLWRPD